MELLGLAAPKRQELAEAESEPAERRKPMDLSMLSDDELDQLSAIRAKIDAAASAG